MCGILLRVESRDDFQLEDVDVIKKRGPDAQREFEMKMGGFLIKGMSSVLHMRGESIVPQPLQSGSLLLQWNGEVFNYQQELLMSENDTRFLMGKFEELSTVNLATIASVIAKIEGPFAMCLIDFKDEYIYFARDVFGRRSLLYSLSESNLKIASTSRDPNMREVPAGVLFAYSVKSGVMEECPFVSKFIIKPILNSSLNSIPHLAWNVFNESLKKRIHCASSKEISILFSGGVDSLLIALGVGLLLPSDSIVHLINVAFEHPSLLANLKKSQADEEYWRAISDRQAGWAGFAELKRLLPGIDFKFHEKNVTLSEYSSSRQYILQLCNPNRTVMDLSLAMVIYHGSHAITKGKILLCGMGADEQLGGYERHRDLKNDSSALLAELQMDLDRISTRNLGRDDRCVGDVGVEGRFPFLDEQFVRFVCEQVPLEAKIDKWLIREMLRLRGVSDTLARRPKKAMQFGAKSAKIESNKQHGEDLLEMFRIEP